MVWSISRIARPSHMSVARIRCRSVCANDHSPPTDTSTVPTGIAATRSRVAAQVRSSMAQAARRRSGCLVAPVGATGKAAVEFGLDEWDHVDAVDAQGTLAIEEPRCVDVRPRHVDGAHHDAG